MSASTTARPPPPSTSRSRTPTTRSATSPRRRDRGRRGPDGNPVRSRTPPRRPDQALHVHHQRPAGVDTFSVVASSGGSVGTVSNLTFNPVTGAGSFDVSFSDGRPLSTVSIQVKDSDDLSNVGHDRRGGRQRGPDRHALLGPATRQRRPDQELHLHHQRSGRTDDTFSIVATSGGAGRHGHATWLFDSRHGRRQLRRNLRRRPSHLHGQRAGQGQRRRSEQRSDDRRGGCQRGPDRQPAGSGHGQRRRDQELHVHHQRSGRTDDTYSIVATSGGSVGTITNLVFDSTTGAGSFDVTFADGVATSTVSVQVKDSDDVLSNVATIDVVVANVAPTVTLCGSGHAPTRARPSTTRSPPAIRGSERRLRRRRHHGPSSSRPSASLAFNSATGDRHLRVTSADGVPPPPSASRSRTATTP